MRSSTNAAQRRAQAGLALFLLVPAASIGTWMALWIAPGTPRGQLIYLACKVWLIVFPAAWFLLVEKQRPVFTLPARRGFWPALASGLLIAAAILLAYRFIGVGWIDVDPMRQKLADAGLNRPAAYWIFSVFIILANSLMEEYVWRWFVFRQCERLIPAMRGWIAVFLSALLFTVHHVVALRAYAGWNVTLLASTGVFIGGAMWSWLYLRYRSLIPCWISHILADVAVYLVGYWILFGS
jgi:membrane protease YdiL (CAAX protease family)